MVVNYLHDVRLASGLPYAQVYGPIFHALAGMLVVGLLANLLVRPVASHHFMTDAELAEEKRIAHEKSLAAAGVDAALASPPADHPLRVTLAWLAVSLPLAYGVWITLQKSAVLFR